MKLRNKDLTYAKLTIWVASLTWMVMFLAFTLVMSWKAGTALSEIFSGATGVFFSWLVPVWMVFTCFLVIIYMCRFIGRKLR